jgi:hypothetical protein
MKRSQNADPGALSSVSRSVIEEFVRCARCAYLRLRHGVGPPPSLPFTLNNAVDALLKREFDVYRTQGSTHPWMEAAGIAAVPMQHPLLPRWRANRSGVRRVHQATGIELYGAIDDLWQAADGTVFVVDYKATGGRLKDSLDADWHAGYKRQAEIYQWLLRGNGLCVSDTAYFVYCFADKEAPGFDARLSFAHRIIPYVGDAAWLDEVMVRLQRTVAEPNPPAAAVDCQYCSYRERAASALALVTD